MKTDASCGGTSAAGSSSEPTRGWASSADCWFVMNICSPSIAPSSTSPVCGLHSGGIYETRSNDLALFGEMDFNAEVFKGYVVSKIAIEAVGFFDNHHAAVRVLAKELDHFSKLLASGCLGCFHIHKLAQNLNAIFKSIFAEQLQLRRNGETLFLLILARYSGVKGCWFSCCGHVRSFPRLFCLSGVRSCRADALQKGRW